MAHAINSALQTFGINTEGPTWGQVSDVSKGDAWYSGNPNAPHQGMSYDATAAKAAAAPTIASRGPEWGSAWEGFEGAQDASHEGPGIGDSSIESGAYDSYGDSGSPGGSPCIIISSCTNRWSYEVNVTREYRDRYLDPITLRGYYAIASVIVPLIRAFRCVKWAIKTGLVDRLIDYGEVVLEKKGKTEKLFSRIVSKAFLNICHYVGRSKKCQ